MKNVIVIPAFNEASAIGAVVASAVAVADAVIVVDDGSADDTGPIAERAGALVVRHMVNRGTGAATATGLQAALRVGADRIVTMDADGQHSPDDARRIFERLAAGDVDFVSGSRMKGLKAGAGRMPIHRRLLNWLGNFLTYLLFGVWVSDSQSGLRGMSRRAASLIELRTNGFEVCSEMVYQVRKHGLAHDELGVSAIYTAYSMSKGQSLAGGWRTATRLILRRLIG